jgi:hypothetical protein
MARDFFAPLIGTNINFRLAHRSIQYYFSSRQFQVTLSKRGFGKEKERR